MYFSFPTDLLALARILWDELKALEFDELILELQALISDIPSIRDMMMLIDIPTNYLWAEVVSLLSTYSEI